MAVPDLKENKVLPDLKVQKVLRENKVFKGLKGIRVILDRKAKRAIKEILVSRVSKGRKARRGILDRKARRVRNAILVSRVFKVFREKGDTGPQGEKGDTGPQGEKGDKGDTGEQDIQGEKGEKGDTGETPEITVVEDTPLNYKLNFKTTTTDITTPNLFKTLDEYHVNLSTANSTLNIPLDNLILTYQYVSSNSARITIAAKNTAIPILADMRRTSIYNSGSVESQTYDNTSVSTRTILDDIIYTLSQETHIMQIRQQNPDTKLWSLCEIHTFISNGGARTSVWVQWYKVGVSYEVT